MKVWVWMGVLAASGLLVAGACGGSGDPAGTPTGVGAAGGGGTSGGGTGGGIGLECSPPCEAGQFCSAIGECIDDGTCRDDADCEEGLECDTVAQACVPGGGCGHEEITAEPIPPNLMIVLDRSCSMRRDLSNQINLPGPNKWTYAVDAIVQLTTQFDGQIRFGLILFPDTVGSDCTQGAPAFAVLPDNELGIQTLLTDALDQADPQYPDGPCVTNIDTAMEQASQEPAFQDTDRKSYALLITDGKQAGCNAAGGDNGTTQIITDMCTAGVSTFVVGFGDLSSGTIDPAQMDIFAQAGCVPNADPNYDFYAAESQTELQQALTTIANETLGCNYQLGETPDDPSEIYVFFDNDPNQIPRDDTHQDGWDYDESTNQVTFYGPTCDSLKAGQVSDVDIVLGCGAPTPD
jgi:hypothetical protein